MNITEELFSLKDEAYKDFQAKLVPTISKESIIGVRVPLLRKFAKDLIKSKKEEVFFEALPHRFYDENMLHSILLSESKKFTTCVERINSFLPFVDNWAVCDILSPKIFKKNREDLLPFIKKWISSKHTYTCRFGMGMLMSHFLEEDFKSEYLRLVAEVESEEYYVNMMVAWFFATALAKQWKESVLYLEEKRLSPWVHNKTIQKAVESYRISKEEKEYLRGLRR